jgi:hypothetical protein
VNGAAAAESLRSDGAGDVAFERRTGGQQAFELKP